MKRFFIISAVLALMCSCAKEQTPPSVLGVYSGTGKDAAVVEYNDGEVIQLDGTSHTYQINVGGDDWFPVTPTDDTWIIAYEKDGVLYVKITANLEDRVRESHVDIRGAGKVVRVSFSQEYNRNMDFVSNAVEIGAADGEYRIALATNVADDEIEVTVNAGDQESWVTDTKVENGYVVLTVTANPSETDVRSIGIAINSGELQQCEATVTQRPMTGVPYEIPILRMDLDTYPVYNVIDSESGKTIAQVAREYLYKYNANKSETIVDGVYTVIYPVSQGADGKDVVDHKNGLVLDNGGEVTWIDEIKSDTPGSDILAHYSEGKETGIPSYVYIPRGSVQPRFAQLSIADNAAKVNVEVEPLMLNDKRGKYTDSYSVVKIAKQYWIRENYRAMYYPDGTAIPIPGERTKWESMMATNKITPMIIVMANSSRYWSSSDGSWESYRSTMGCCYTYSTLVNAADGIDVGAQREANFAQEDKISPEGWTVPSKEDYQVMVDYLVQVKNLSTAKQRQEILIQKLCATDAMVPGENITGFSAKGSNVGSTGGYVNDNIYYLTLDYIYNSSNKSHYVYALRLTDANTAAVNTVGFKGGYHVRLIMEQ